jgi:DNA-binding MarR family transcriptional regulator
LTTIVNVVDYDPDGDAPHVLAALDWVRRRVGADLRRLVPEEFAQLRGSHGRILDMVRADGSRPTELAEGAWITKQAISTRIRELEGIGLVEVAPDPHDGRAVVVRRTAAGDRTREAATGAIRAMEEEWAAQVGQERYETFRQVLAELADGYR